MSDLTIRNDGSFQINNQVYVLGNPVISVDTLEQLVQKLDSVGAGQPIVIINPKANTIPDFDIALSNLIQNNRTRQVTNVTNDDKYRFKDFTDEQLTSMAAEAASNTGVPEAQYLEIYQGLRLRAQYLFYIEQLNRERDSIWANHCANPESNEGVDRYQELCSKLIPEAQSYYQFVCTRLQELQESINQYSRNTQPVAANEEVITHNNTTTQQETRAANVATQSANVEPTSQNNNIPIVNSNQESSFKVWGPWMDSDYMVMPVSAARKLLGSPMYSGLTRQQTDCEVDGVHYKAVPSEYLLALGIPVYPDGLPVVFTEIGKFKRVGSSEQPLNNLDYWYPEPRRGL